MSQYRTQPASTQRGGEAAYVAPVWEPSRAAVWRRRVTVGLCVLFWLLGTAASATAVLAVGDPVWVSRYGAAVVTVVGTLVLAHRCGARVLIWVPLAVLVVGAALYLERNWLYAAASVIVAVVMAVLAVMITRPAAATVRVIGEFLLAVAVAVSGSLAVAAWNAPLVYQRYSLVVLALALLLTLSVVWRLGAGLHGLGRRGFLLIVGAAVLLALILAYGTAVRTYGSAAVVETLDDTVLWLRAHVGGVPRPAQVLIGFPALVWGIGTRAVRRQGWWMCTFGVVGTASVTTSLASPYALPAYLGLSTLYSVVLGLGLGLLVRRLDLGSRASGRRRARSSDTMVASRPEAARTESLK